MPSQDPERVIELRFPSRADRLKLVRCLVREAALRAGIDEEEADRVVLAVNEACTNVIQHAYGPHGGGDIVLEIVESVEALVFRLTDFAPPIDPGAVKPRRLDELRPGGLGVHLMGEVMDSVAFVEAPPGAGNVLELRKNLESSEEDG